MAKQKKEDKAKSADAAKEAPENREAVTAKPETESTLPVLKPGDDVKVYYRVLEGGKERTQVYEGTVIALKNSGVSRTVTVRKNSYGIAVERIFPLYSRLLQKIEVKKHTKVRRAKLYYLRKLKGKLSRLKELRQ